MSVQTANAPARHIAILIGIAFLMLAIMAARFEFNWDEFYVLNYLYRFQAGELTNPLQTIFVHGFDWLRGIGRDEAARLVTARFVMLACFAWTCAMIFLIGRRFYSLAAVLTAILAYISVSYVFRSAISFRVDGMVTALMMTVLWLTSAPKQNWIKVISAGFLIGLCGLLSMKSIFYTPVIAIFLLARWAKSGWAAMPFLQGFVMFAAALFSFASLYWLHGQTLPPNSSGLDYAASMGSASLFENGVFPQARIFLKALVQNPLYWILIGLGYAALREQMHGVSAHQKWDLVCKLSFLLPLLSLALYRHSHPYYYVFMLAPVSLIAAASIQHFIIDNRSKLLAPLIGVFSLWIAGVFTVSMMQTQTYQRQLISLVHDIFPEPVPYLDFCAMMSSFPRIEEGGIFINRQTLDMDEYYIAGRPIMDGIIDRHQPKFLIANVTGLDLEGRDRHRNDNDLLPKDMQILRSHYARHWGPLYLPGKSLAAAQTGTLEIKISGVYSVSADVEIDGKPYSAGTAIPLSLGNYTYSAANDVVLSWGQNTPVPNAPEPTHMLFRGF